MITNHFHHLKKKTDDASARHESWQQSRDDLDAELNQVLATETGTAVLEKRATANFLKAGAKAKATAKAKGKACAKAKAKAKLQFAPPKAAVFQDDAPLAARKVRRNRYVSSAYHSAYTKTFAEEGGKNYEKGTDEYNACVEKAKVDARKAFAKAGAEFDNMPENQ